jgi:O-acetylserine/cysteine efflux transporter
MPLSDVTTAVFVAALWGFNFVAMKVGVDAMPPFLLASLRFVPVLVVLAALRPPLPARWHHVLGIGVALGTLMFTFLYLGIAAGMPAGLASVVVQSQAMFTLLLSAIVTARRPGGMQLVGIAVASGGLALAARATAMDTTLPGFLLVLAAAFAWATANLLIARAQARNMLHLMLWMSVVPPVPLALLSFLLEGPEAMMDALVGIDAAGVLSLLYLGLASTVLAYSLWAMLLRRHPAHVVAPFSLLVPFFGLASTALFLGEEVGAADLGAFAAVLAGLALLSFPDRLRRLAAWNRPGGGAATGDRRRDLGTGA